MQFTRFQDEKPPQIEGIGEGRDSNEQLLKIKVHDSVLDEEVVYHPSYLVLSTGIRPQLDAQELGTKLKVPVDKNGYFLEAHMKLRPVDFATEGVFLCGLAHAPKLAAETIAQASAAAARAGTLLARREVVIDSIAAVVDPAKCRACSMCINLCPYAAPSFVEGPTGTKTSWINPALCKGCGVCVSSCPDHAISAPFFTDLQLCAQLEVLSGGGVSDISEDQQEPEPEPKLEPEQGVA